METKEELIKTIREWVKIDNDIRTLQKEQYNRKNDKKKLSSLLIEIMKKNEIDCFDINDGQIIYTKKNVKKPITKKMLLDLLGRYYKGDLLKANDINNFIINNRDEKIQEEIVRKIQIKDLSS